MKILVHMHSFNDEDSIDRAMQTVLDQTYAVEKIVLVDNGSTDATVHRQFPPQVHLIQHARNLGTSGSVKTGLEYALGEGYEWLWVLDADSTPRPDALEQLVNLYHSFDQDERKQIGVLSCSQLLPSSKCVQGRLLTPGGPRVPSVNPDLPYCECDSTIWSGSLINLQAVREVGLPRCGENGCWEDLGLDYGDVEYTYRIRRAGYTILAHRFSIIDHPIGQAKWFSFLGRPLIATNHSPNRRYLYFRNLVYFWLYIYPRRDWLKLSVWFAYRMTVTLCTISLMEKNAAKKIRACLRGIRDGWHKKLDETYEDSGLYTHVQ